MPEKYSTYYLYVNERKHCWPIRFIPFLLHTNHSVCTGKTDKEDDFALGWKSNKSSENSWTNSRINKQTKKSFHDHSRSMYFGPLNPNPGSCSRNCMASGLKIEKIPKKKTCQISMNKKWSYHSISVYATQDIHFSGGWACTLRNKCGKSGSPELSKNS